MPTQKNVTGTRFGRFKTDAATTSLPILVGRVGSVYRLLNAGKEAFTVNPNGSTNLAVATKSSVDFFVNKNPTTVTTGAGKSSGIYDDVKLTFADLRPGRFEFKDATATDHLIVDLTGRGSGSTKLVYRILNSGEKSFTVNDGSATHTVVSEQSIDVELAAAGTIKVKATADSVEITGIYELLNQI